ncbi:unnamed protein product [Microthlaspi erraticum]|uniref:Uncharacterized protein n=1 Tax=Microthlaspi erraticum TaxID=1685480 RepID=A0A6D2JD48_9BRAS|nr:unnamed protein product [Microthlaspi erraticum]
MNDFGRRLWAGSGTMPSWSDGAIVRVAQIVVSSRNGRGAMQSCAAYGGETRMVDRGTMLLGSVCELGRALDGMERGRSAWVDRGTIVPRSAGTHSWNAVARSKPSGPVFTDLIITPCLLIQMMRIHLRWRVNSIRARCEVVLMKSVE